MAQAAASASPRWQVAAPADHDCRVLGDEALVFVVATGETHALDPTATAVFLTLAEAPESALTVEGWIRRMDATGDPTASMPAPEELETMHATLESLREIGLVQASPAP